MPSIEIVVNEYPYSAPLKATPEICGLEVRCPSINPVFSAFAAMISEQRYDICEMAIGAFLQARDEGKPLWLLPVVMAGGFQYRNLYPTPTRTFASPAELAGGRVGVRAYSQTTGLWVRAWLAEEFGVDLDSVTWVVTERSHAPDYVDPDNVELIAGSLEDELVSGGIDAAVLGVRWTPDGVGPMVADWAERDRAWYAEHGFVPINHLVTVSGSFLENHPDAVRAVYRSLADGIDATSAQREAGAEAGMPSAIRRGFSAVGPAVETAARYAYTQGLIHQPLRDVEELFAFGTELD